MKLVLTVLLILSSMAACFEAHAFDPAEIDTLLATQDSDSSYVIIGILTLDYTFNDLLGKDISLHDVTIAMSGILKFIAEDKDTARKEKIEKLGPGISIAKMLAALKGIYDEPMSSTVSWRESSQSSHSRAPFENLQARLLDLAGAGIILPLTYLDEKHRPAAGDDGNYTLPKWYLEHSDWSAQFGDLRYYDLMTREACDAPCTDAPSKETLARAEAVQAAIQLGILRTTKRNKLAEGVTLASGFYCCKMPQRVCANTAPLGCTQGTNGYCTLGSYYCP